MTDRKLISWLKAHWALLAILATGIILRLYNLTKISLWHDEAFSALLVKYPWGEMFYRIGLDVHPPLYYVFLRIWHYIFGHSLFSLRAMSVLFGVGTIVLVYFFIKRFFNNKAAALTAALLVAVNPFQIQYVTEARMYTMGAFFAVLAAFLLGLALEHTLTYYKQKKRIVKSKMLWSYVGFTLSASILMYTHYYLLFTVAALGLYGLWFLYKNFGLQFKKYLWLILSGVGLIILYLPWLQWFFYQYKQVGAGYWIPPMDMWSIPHTLYELTIRIANPSKVLLALVTIAALWIIISFLKRYSNPEKWLALAVFLAPFGGAILFAILAKLQGGDSSVYLVRYFIFASSFLLIIIALWMQQIRVRGLRAILIILLVATNLFSVGYYWQQVKVSEKPGMAGLAKLIDVNAKPLDKIISASSFEYFNYKYYYNHVYDNQNSLQPKLYTGGSRVENLPHFAGTAILTDEELALSWEEAVEPGDNVWVIWTTGFGGSKPANLPANWTEIEEFGFAEVRPYVGTWVVVTHYKVN